MLFYLFKFVRAKFSPIGFWFWSAPSPRQAEEKNVHSEIVSPAGRAEGADQKPIKNCPREGWFYTNMRSRNLPSAQSN
jgi:hypothetical protein